MGIREVVTLIYKRTMAGAISARRDIIAPTREQVIRSVSLIGGAFVATLLVTSPLRQEPPIAMACYAAMVGTFGVAHALRRTRLGLAGATCSLGVLCLATWLAWIRGGWSAPSIIASYVTLATLAGLSWGWRGAWLTTGIASVAVAWFVSQAPMPSPHVGVQLWAELVIQMVLLVVVVQVTLRALQRSVVEAVALETRFQEVVAASPDAIVVLDTQGAIRLFNAKAANVSGTSAARAVGRTLADLGWLGDASLRRLEALLHESRSGSVPPIELEGKGGSLLEASVSTVSRADGKVDLLLAIRDVTERRRAEQARETLEARILQSKSVEALGRLAGGIAHDFNNMLTIVLGTTELMRESTRGNPSLEEDRRRIENAASRAAELTAQLLAFGRKQVLEPRVFCLNGTLRGLTPLLQRLTREDIDVQVHAAPDLGNVRVDEARLEQVIVNLVTNASDAMPNGGRLTIETQNVSLDATYTAQHPDVRPGEYVQIAVCDTGPGMSDDVQERIFEPFYTTKPRGKGTGLGLAMVQGIVAQSGGHIFVYSAPGRGTCFKIYFPRTRHAAVERPRSKPPIAGHPAAHILLVEDENGVRDAARRMMQGLGHAVEEAEDGRKAIEKFEARVEEFDLLVTDVVMPHVSGRVLADRFLSKHPRLKVLFISGYTENAIVHHGVLDPGLHFLAKPFTRASLATKLAEVLSDAGFEAGTVEEKDLPSE